MLKDRAVASFFDSPAFDELLVKVGNDDRVSFKNNNAWLAKHPAASIIFSMPEEIWDRIKNTYRTTFSYSTYW